MPLIVPAPRESFDIELADGTKIKMRRYGNSGGVRLLLSHGNGFAIDAYLPFWQLLLAKYDVLVFDFRNHGQNLPTQPSNHNYAQFARDLNAILDAVHLRMGQKTIAGIFHSMSARAAMKHAIEDLIHDVYGIVDVRSQAKVGARVSPSPASSSHPKDR